LVAHAKVTTYIILWCRTQSSLGSLRLASSMLSRPFANSGRTRPNRDQPCLASPIYKQHRCGRAEASARGAMCFDGARHAAGGLLITCASLSPRGRRGCPVLYRLKPWFL
jgi:hypothetical protein